MTKKHDEDVFTMDPKELAKRVTGALEHLAKARALLPGLVALSVDERRTSSGKLGRDEPAAMRSLLIAASKHPEFFTALADKDGGVDDAVFEAEPAMKNLDRITALTPALEEAEAFVEILSDTLLDLGSAARDVVKPVQAIINANKSVARGLAADAAQGLEYFSERGRRAARARRKKPGVQIPA